MTTTYNTLSGSSYTLTWTPPEADTAEEDQQWEADQAAEQVAKALAAAHSYVKPAPQLWGATASQQIQQLIAECELVDPATIYDSLADGGPTLSQQQSVAEATELPTAADGTLNGTDPADKGSEGYTPLYGGTYTRSFGTASPQHFPNGAASPLHVSEPSIAKESAAESSPANGSHSCTCVDPDKYPCSDCPDNMLIPTEHFYGSHIGPPPTDEQVEAALAYIKAHTPPAPMTVSQLYKENTGVAEWHAAGVVNGSHTVPGSNCVPCGDLASGLQEGDTIEWVPGYLDGDPDNVFAVSHSADSVAYTVADLVVEYPLVLVWHYKGVISGSHIDPIGTCPPCVYLAAEQPNGGAVLKKGSGSHLLFEQTVPCPGCELQVLVDEWEEGMTVEAMLGMMEGQLEELVAEYEDPWVVNQSVGFWKDGLVYLAGQVAELVMEFEADTGFSHTEWVASQTDGCEFPECMGEPDDGSYCPGCALEAQSPTVGPIEQPVKYSYQEIAGAEQTKAAFEKALTAYKEPVVIPGKVVSDTWVDFKDAGQVPIGTPTGSEKLFEGPTGPIHDLPATGSHLVYVGNSWVEHGGSYKTCKVCGLATLIPDTPPPVLGGSAEAAAQHLYDEMMANSPLHAAGKVIVGAQSGDSSLAGVSEFKIDTQKLTKGECLRLTLEGKIHLVGNTGWAHVGTKFDCSACMLNAEYLSVIDGDVNHLSTIDRGQDGCLICGAPLYIASGLPICGHTSDQQKAHLALGMEPYGVSSGASPAVVAEPTKVDLHLENADGHDFPVLLTSKHPTSMNVPQTEAEAEELKALYGKPFTSAMEQNLAQYHQIPPVNTGTPGTEMNSVTISGLPMDFKGDVKISDGKTEAWYHSVVGGTHDNVHAGHEADCGVCQEVAAGLCTWCGQAAITKWGGQPWCASGLTEDGTPNCQAQKNCAWCAMPGITVWDGKPWCGGTGQPLCEGGPNGAASGKNAYVAFHTADDGETKHLGTLLDCQICGLAPENHKPWKGGEKVHLGPIESCPTCVKDQVEWEKAAKSPPIPKTNLPAPFTKCIVCGNYATHTDPDLMPVCSAHSAAVKFGFDPAQSNQPDDAALVPACTVPGCSEPGGYMTKLGKVPVCASHWKTMAKAEALNPDYFPESSPTNVDPAISKWTDIAPAAGTSCVECGEPALHWNSDGYPVCGMSASLPPILMTPYPSYPLKYGPLNCFVCGMPGTGQSAHGAPVCDVHTMKAKKLKKPKFVDDDLQSTVKAKLKAVADNLEMVSKLGSTMEEFKEVIDTAHKQLAQLQQQYDGIEEAVQYTEFQGKMKSYPHPNGQGTFSLPSQTVMEISSAVDCFEEGLLPWQAGGEPQTEKTPMITTFDKLPEGAEYLGIKNGMAHYKIPETHTYGALVLSQKLLTAKYAEFVTGQTEQVIHDAVFAYKAAEEPDTYVTGVDYVGFDDPEMGYPMSTLPMPKEVKFVGKNEDGLPIFVLPDQIGDEKVTPELANFLKLKAQAAVDPAFDKIGSYQDGLTENGLKLAEGATLYSAPLAVQGELPWTEKVILTTPNGNQQPYNIGYVVSTTHVNEETGASQAARRLFTKTVIKDLTYMLGVPPTRIQLINRKHVIFADYKGMAGSEVMKQYVTGLHSSIELPEWKPVGTVHHDVKADKWKIVSKCPKCSETPQSFTKFQFPPAVGVKQVMLEPCQHFVAQAKSKNGVIWIWPLETEYVESPHCPVCACVPINCEPHFGGMDQQSLAMAAGGNIVLDGSDGGWLTLMPCGHKVQRVTFDIEEGGVLVLAKIDPWETKTVSGKQYARMG